MPLNLGSYSHQNRNLEFLKVFFNIACKEFFTQFGSKYLAKLIASSRKFYQRCRPYLWTKKGPLHFGRHPNLPWWRSALSASSCFQCMYVYVLIQANSAFYPSRVGKWGPDSAGEEKAGMVHSVSGWTRSVQVKLWDPFRVPYLSALEVCSRQGAIQIHVYFTLPLA